MPTDPFGAGDRWAVGIEIHPLDEAWAKATDALPHGMFGPAVEPRFSGRWRAWFYWPAPDTRDSISAFGATEAEALLNLVAEVKS